MEDRAPVLPTEESSPSTSSSALTSSATRRKEGRGAWVLTAYGICGLALFGVLAYYFSDYIAH
jgi:hypothetical protein